MNTIPAGEIKRRGIAAVDQALREGPVHVIRENRPQYVVLNEDQYRELVEASREAHVSRVREALADVREGRTRPVSIADIRKLLDLEP